mgnify:CR=1 FL=1
MVGWQGWIAALGGLLAIVDVFLQTGSQWLTWVGGIVAIVFGIWASAMK